MAFFNITLSPGVILYVQSSALNDFEFMAVGPVTVIYGWTFTGNATAGGNFFIQR